MTESSPGEPESKYGRWKVNPFAEHLHLPPVTVKEDAARMEFVVEPIHLRPGGVLHGGVLAAVLDTVTGFAAYSIAPPNHEVLTMQLNMNMTATAKLGERIVATGKVVHAGRRTAVVHGEIRLADGKLLASGSTTMFFVAEGLSR